MFNYVDLESVQGTELKSFRRESIETAPSRAQRLAIKGDLFYQTVRPYQKNNYLFNRDDTDFVFSTGYAQVRPEIDGVFLLSLVQTTKFVNSVLVRCTGTSYPAINSSDLSLVPIKVPKNNDESINIGMLFSGIDNTITLHQRKYIERRDIMLQITNDDLFVNYYMDWVNTYKKGAVREVTLSKYKMTHIWLTNIVPNLVIGDLTRNVYQNILNDYALHHEKQTTMDFHHQLKGAILDAVDEGLIVRDPTRKAIIKGREPGKKKPKFLNQFELQTLIKSLDLGESLNWDWLILLIAKTGMRFSEALALTPEDFDFMQQTININKTWDYKNNDGFMPTKNRSSNRKIRVDWQTVSQFSGLINGLDVDKPIFVNGKIYNSTVNNVLFRHCKKLGIPTISIHGLRHTHASLLLFSGVSVASVARRLGHSSMTTTQNTYLHIIHELENQDTDLVIRSLSQLI